MTMALPLSTLRIVGYCMSFGVGLILWPQLMEVGTRYENTNFLLALTLVWGCLPVSMTITWIGSYIYMNAIHIGQHLNRKALIDRSVQTGALLGIAGCLGSCGMIASGYEPPEPLHGIYDIQFHQKYR
jgi:hypothetical protein